MSEMAAGGVTLKTLSDCFINKIESMEKQRFFDWIQVTDEDAPSDMKPLKGLAALEYYVRQALDDGRRQLSAPGFHQSFEGFLLSQISAFQRKWRFEGRIEYGAEIALLHYHLGLHLYQQKNHDEGVRNLMEAMHYLGSYEGVSLLNNYTEVQERYKKEAASAGGKAKTDKNKVVKDKAVELLREKEPEFSWSNKTEALEAIVDELGRFIDYYNEETKKINAKVKLNEQTRRHIDLKPDALFDSLQKWSRTDADLKQALDDVTI